MVRSVPLNLVNLGKLNGNSKESEMDVHSMPHLIGAELLLTSRHSRK